MKKLRVDTKCIQISHFEITSISISGGTMHSFSMLHWCRWEWRLLLLLLCRLLLFVWLFKWCSSLIGDSLLGKMYSFSKWHRKSVCMPTETVWAICCCLFSDCDNCCFGCCIGDVSVGGFPLGGFVIKGSIMVDDSLLIACCCCADSSVAGDVSAVAPLLGRRLTSTRIGSDAFRNSLTASSCAKLLTSLPLTCNRFGKWINRINRISFRGQMCMSA